jgi:hypothetical protein
MPQIPMSEIHLQQRGGLCDLGHGRAVQTEKK